MVDNNSGHECGEVVADSSNLLVDVDEKGILGLATVNLCAVWNLVEMEDHGPWLQLLVVNDRKCLRGNV
jgi:hypothetical protein